MESAAGSGRADRAGGGAGASGTFAAARSRSRSLTMPLAIAGAYALAAGAYVLVSGQLAVASEDLVSGTQRTETVAGLGFLVITTLGVFVGAWFAGRRAQSDLRLVVQREQGFVDQQSKVLVGALAASVAHDSNNVLVALRGEIDAVAARAEWGGAEASLARLRAGVDRLVALNGRLLGMPMEWTIADVARIVQDGIASMRSHAALAHGTIEYVGAASMPMPTLPVLVHEIVGNLVLNACEATAGEGEIEVRLFEDERAVVLEVHDAGPGVPPERRATLFDSMKSTKTGGFGLGLFSVRACAEQLGGRVEVADSPLGGALFRVRLPRPRPTATEPSSE